MGDAPQDRQDERGGGMHDERLAPGVDLAVECLKLPMHRPVTLPVAARLAREEQRLEELTVLRVVLPRVMPDRTLERLHGGGALLGARLHQDHPSASPGNRQMDTELLGPGSARALERARYLVEAPPVVLDRLRDADAEFSGEGVLGGNAEPAQYEGQEPEVERRAVRAPVGLPEEPLRFAPQLGSETGSVALDFGAVLAGERETVGQGIERSQQMGGGSFHGSLLGWMDGSGGEPPGTPGNGRGRQDRCGGHG